ncbi:hypothetical protein [Bdellovibrio sp. HCB2-146]|uniref:hypothetical protein n=1 Tax=Bdellovibrio sp. HCB2-146 TaxID=3394362 RepID=UPI0039BC3C9E
MKKLIISLVVVSAAMPAFAGKMKEIWQSTNESVLETLGFDEGDVSVSGYKFEKTNDGLAVKTTVKGKYKVQGIVPTFDCTTSYKGKVGNYKLVDTFCDQVN